MLEVGQTKYHQFCSVCLYRSVCMHPSFSLSLVVMSQYIKLSCQRMFPHRSFCWQAADISCPNNRRSSLAFIGPNFSWPVFLWFNHARGTAVLACSIRKIEQSFLMLRDCHKTTERSSRWNESKRVWMEYESALWVGYMNNVSLNRSGVTISFRLLPRRVLGVMDTRARPHSRQQN